MATAAQRPKLLAIVGPTASGKSELALRTAREFDGEIITADSRTIYKDMDIGTAKPNSTAREEINHWGLDLIEPGQSYSAHQFQTYAQERIEDIQKRGKLPILVGGTGLYIDSVLYNFKFRPKGKLKERQKLETLDIASLQEIIKQNGYEMPENSQNKRHLVRTIEIEGQVSSKSSKPINGSLIVGLLPDDETLKRRINDRVKEWLEQGLMSEVKKLYNKYGEEFIKTSGIGYQACVEAIKGNISEKEAEVSSLIWSTRQKV